MGRSILDFSAEIQYMIFDNLKPESPEEIAEDDDFELQRIFMPDLRNLSRTCKYYYSTLLPFMFKRIVLQNDETSAVSVKCCLERHAILVKEIYFTNTMAMMDALEDPSCQGHDKHWLPNTAMLILCTLSRFPNLESIVVHWRFDDESYTWFSIGVQGSPLSPFEIDLETAEVSEKWSWRGLMRDVYDSLCSSVSSLKSLKSLEFKHVPPHPVPTYKSTKWKNVLGNVDTFKISLSHLPGDYHINTVPAYRTFCSDMGGFFFDHLRNATKLHMAAWDGPLDGYWIDLSLFPGQLPKLTSLYLGNCFICHRLLDFLVSHADKIEKVELEICSAMGQRGYFWSQLFAPLAEANPQSLVEFIVSEGNETFFGEGDSDADVEEVEKCQKLLSASGGKRRAFSYAYVDGKYGFVQERGDLVRSRFLDGRDQEAYDALMRIIDRNRAWRSK